MLECGWLSLMWKFREKYGKHLHDECLPAQSYFEQFEERLADGNLQAERLDHVVSAQEEKDQKAKKPEPVRQLGLHLDSSLTIQTKRRFMSTMPRTTEQFRMKYKVMSHCWLLAQLRQSGRHLYSDLTEISFPRICDELLSQKNFLMEKDFGSRRISAPDWDLCLAYELEIRREAVRLATEEGFSFQRAWWTAYTNDHHRMEHWQSFLKVSGDKSSSSSDDSKDRKIAQLEKKLNDLSRQVQNRSRSPRGKGRTQKALPAPAQPSQPAPLAPKSKGKRQSKGKGRGQNGKGQKNGSQSGRINSFRDLMDIPRQ